MESSVVQRVSRGGVDLPAAVRGSHESSRGLLQAASARDGAQAKRCSSTLARHVWDRRFGVHTGVGGARANSVRTTAADSGQDEQRRRRSTTNRPSHLQAPSAFCSLACRALRLRDDETAGVVPWCDCASGQRLFRLSGRCRLHRRDDAACSLLRTVVYTPLHAVSSTTEHCNSACWRLALRLSCPVCWRAQCRTYMRSVHTHAYAVCIHRYIHTIIHCFHPK